MEDPNVNHDQSWTERIIYSEGTKFVVLNAKANRIIIYDSEDLVLRPDLLFNISFHVDGQHEGFTGKEPPIYFYSKFKTERWIKKYLLQKAE